MTLQENVLILGGIIIDQYLMIDSFPNREADVLITDSFEHVGGCAINVGTTLKNLGMVPHVVSVLGEDNWGRKIYDYLVAEQFPTDSIRRMPQHETGYCITMVEGSGARTFFTYKGCESNFYPDMVDNEMMSQISHVYLTGYFLLDPLYTSDIVSLVERLKNQGATVLFDPCALVDQISPDVLTSIIHLSDIVTPNVNEMEKMKRVLSVDSNITQWLHDRGVGVIAQKMGNQGVEVWTEERHFHVPSYNVLSRDTTGAGDSFAGGLIYGLVQQFDIEKSFKFACACGALTTTMVGPHAHFTLDDVLNVMKA